MLFRQIFCKYTSRIVIIKYNDQSSQSDHTVFSVAIVDTKQCINAQRQLSEPLDMRFNNYFIYKLSSCDRLHGSIQDEKERWLTLCIPFLFAASLAIHAAKLSCSHPDRYA